MTQPLTKDQFEILLGDVRRLDGHVSNRLDNVEATMLRIEKDLGEDRIKFDDIKLRQGTIERILEDGIRTIIEYLNRHDRTLESIVTKAVQKTTSETFTAVQDTIEAINLPPVKVNPIVKQLSTNEKPIVKQMPKPSLKDKLFGFIKR